MMSGKRGFGSMNPDKHREIAQKGGSSIPNEKRSFSINKDLAREAGRKGGLATGAKRNSQAQKAGNTEPG